LKKLADHSLSYINMDIEDSQHTVLRQDDEFDVRLMINPSTHSKTLARSGSDAADNVPSQSSASGIFSDCPRIIMTAWREWRNSPPVVQAVDDANHKGLEFLQWLRVTSE